MTTLTLSAAPEEAPPRGPWRRAARATWLLHRAPLVALGLVGMVLLVVIVAEGVAVHGAFSHYLGDGCATAGGAGTCPVLSKSIADRSTFLSDVVIVLHVVPVLVGVFIGAPLISREMESGSFRFTWTQGMGRTSFELRRLVLLAVSAVAVAVVLSLLLGWYAHPLEVVGAQSRWDAGLFATTPLLLPAWTVFALAVGALLGYVVGHSVGAMAASAVVVGGLLVGAVLYLNDWLLRIAAVVGHPKTNGVEWGALNRAASAGQGPKGSWLVQAWMTGPRGHVLDTTGIFAVMRRMPKSVSSPPAWLASMHYGYWISYQPAGRFWIFQCAAAAVLVVVAAAAAFALSRLMGHRG